MFRVAFFVDDKKLGDALKALVGVAYQVEAPQPVTNADKDPVTKKLKAATSSGSIIDIVTKAILELDKNRITLSELVKMTTALGAVDAYAYQIRNRLITRGVLKRTTDPTVYLVRKQGKIASKPKQRQRAKHKRSNLANGSATDAFAKRLNQTKKVGDSISVSEMRSFVVQHHLSPKSYTNIARNLRGAGVLKPTKVQGVYTVAKPAPEHVPHFTQ